jgi:CBS domain containing-hemolysin-like protein
VPEGGPTWTPLLLVALPAAVALLSLAALLERSGPIRLRHWAEEAGGALRRLYDSPARFEFYRFLLSLGARLALIALALALHQRLLDAGPRAATVLAIGAAGAVAAASELVNRLFLARDPERSLRRLTGVYRGTLWLLSPLVVLLAPLVPLRRPPRAAGDGEDEASDEEIEAFLDVGTQEGILERDEQEMVWGIVDFGETAVRSIMTPRIDMVCAPVDAALDALAARFVESKRSRLPLYQESIDQIVGILDIRDLLRGLRSSPPPRARDLGRPPFVVPETKLLKELLREMQRGGHQMAIVLDEYGGTAGLATLEDLVEEIVGEIADEYDRGPREKEALPDGAWRLRGDARLELLAELFEVDVDGAPYETVGGLVMGTLGYVPKAGESAEALGLRFTAEVVSGRRVQRVRVDRQPRPAAEEA